MAGLGRFLTAALVALLVASGGQAQEQRIERLTVPSPVLTIDQDRLFATSLYGQRIARELAAVADELSRENRKIETALSEEEKQLTDQRPDMDPDEFRELADAFDTKVQAIRRAQDAKARELNRRTETEQQMFLNRVLPVLAEVVRARGAVVILDRRAVFVAVENIDVTDDAIARIDAQLGDGSGALPPDQE